jgi:uncharacterized membrane-anchored protein YitT (DUF2179 family)
MKIKEDIAGFNETTKNWLYDHPRAKNAIDYAWTFVVCTISALVFAFGFNAFMDLGTKVTDTAGNEMVKLVAGGVSGVGQVLTVFMEICGWKSTAEGGTLDEHLAYSVMYFVINIPLFILAWTQIGKRFAIFTLINVAEVSLFMKLLTIDNVEWIQFLAKFVSDNGGLLARALFAGVLTGLSSALAFKVDISAGGIDIIAYYIALKKNTMVGKYSVMLNSVTVVMFAIMTSWKASWDATLSAAAFGRIFYSVLYMLVGMIVVDTINVRNKKLKAEVISSRKDLGEVLIASIPHGATMIKGVGVYSGQDRYIFTMVVSSYEVNDLLKVVQKEDPSAFVQVVELNRVVGRFHVKPVK